LLNPEIEYLKPSKIVCVGLNYKQHAEELKMEIPEEPVIFLKPVSSIVCNEDYIVLPEASEQVDYEAELAVIIGEDCKNVRKENVRNVIQGFTCANDVTARDLQTKDVQWTRAKSFDTFCPLGPSIIKVDDPNNLQIKAYLNDKVVQDSHTSDMIFNVEQIVSYISKIMTLKKDDIILTGTPSGIGPLKKGDEIVIELAEIGRLKNVVV